MFSVLILKGSISMCEMLRTFERERQKLICVETVQYLEGKSPAMDHRFVAMLESKGCIRYVGTFINQIFVDIHSK
jgi:hypothetical protein